MPGSNDRLALACGLGAVLLWSTVATAFKLSLAHLAPLTLVTLAALVSWGFFGLGLLSKNRLATLRALPWAAIRRSLAIGLLNPGLYYVVLLEAYDALPAQEAMAINYSWALTLPLVAAPLLQQRLRTADLVTALVSYAGVLIIITRGDVTGFTLANPAGAGLALVSTLLWALYWVANTRQRLDPLIGLFLNFSGALPPLIAFTVATGGFNQLSPPGALGAAYIGIFEMGLAFVLWQVAMNSTSSTARISTLIFLSPPTSLVLIWAVLGEAIEPSTIAGLAFILTGLGLQHALNPRV